MKTILQFLRGESDSDSTIPLTKIEFKLLLAFVCVALAAFGLIMHGAAVRGRILRIVEPQSYLLKTTT